MESIGKSRYGHGMVLAATFERCDKSLPPLLEDSTFGINETDIWRCSMFSENSLAEQCAKNPSQFNKSLSECHEFIPPPDLLGLT